MFFLLRMSLDVSSHGMQQIFHQMIFHPQCCQLAVAWLKYPRVHSDCVHTLEHTHKRMLHGRGSNLFRSARLDIIYRERPDPPSWVYNNRSENNSNDSMLHMYTIYDNLCICITLCICIYIYCLTKRIITNTYKHYTNILHHHFKSQLTRAHSTLSQLSAPQTWPPRYWMAHAQPST